MANGKKSQYDKGDLVQTKVPLYGFPVLYVFEVTDPIKKPARVENRKVKYTIRAKDPLAMGVDRNREYVLPTKMIERA